MFLLSYFVLKETYNIFALFGILSIIVGVSIINYYGVQKKDETNQPAIKALTILQKEHADNTCTTHAPLVWKYAVDTVALIDDHTCVISYYVYLYICLIK